MHKEFIQWACDNCGRFEYLDRLGELPINWRKEYSKDLCDSCVAVVEKALEEQRAKKLGFKLGLEGI